jgi:predicted transcriptional regulator
MATLGDLERSVMEILWADAEQLSAYDLQERLHGRELAATTILTVLSRLEKKGFVARTREARPHLYAAAASREEHMADLMHEVLGTASNRTAVL